jgi:molybdopterin/thiamine biosynthesis adenylyltransferase
VTAEVTLSLTGDHHQLLRQHLFPGDGKEAAAIGVCGRRAGSDRHKLLVREIHPVPYSTCSVRAPDRIAWPVSWLDPLLEKSERLDLSIVKFHSHPADYRRFSLTDDGSDKELFAGIHGWMDRDIPHASAVMLPDGSIFGRAIDGDGNMSPLRTIAVIGDNLLFWHADTVIVDQSAGVGRVTSAFGRKMMAELARLTAAVVGASGTGSIIIEQLHRLGFGRVVLVDPEAVELKNLNRIVNARMRHARAAALKVHIAGEAIAETALGTRVDAYPVNILDREAIEAVAAADILFGCVDTAEGRDVLNRISTYYVLPYVDVGVGIVPLEDGTLDEINGVVHYVKPGGSSLLSRGAYRPEQVGADALRRQNPSLYAERRREKYIEGAGEEGPAVISVNMTMASLAANECLARIYRFRNLPNREYAELRISLTEMEIEAIGESEPCRFLAKHVGEGDTNPLLGLPELSL